MPETQKANKAHLTADFLKIHLKLKLNLDVCCILCPAKKSSDTTPPFKTVTHYFKLLYIVFLQQQHFTGELHLDNVVETHRKVIF